MDIPCRNHTKVKVIVSTLLMTLLHGYHSPFRYAQEKVFLAPPQIVENLRLLNFSTIEELSRYLVERSSKGLERWTPYIVKTVDSIVVQLLPGLLNFSEYIFDRCY